METQEISGLIQRVQKTLYDIDNWKESLRSQETQLATERQKETSLEKALELNSKAQIVLQMMFEKLNEKGIMKLSQLLTAGLNQIYPQRVYEVLYEVVPERGSNSLNFFLKELRDDGSVIVSNIRNATGGSIRTITGLITTLFYIMKAGGRRLLVIDEGLAQVEDNALTDMFEMMKSFGRSAGFVYLLISHDPRFVPFADRIWWAEKGGLKKIK